MFALDKSKFGRKALNLTTPFDESFTIITDNKPNVPVTKAISTAKAKLILAKK